jgi:Protein of unknown function (DUF2924)
MSTPSIAKSRNLKTSKKRSVQSSATARLKVMSAATGRRYRSLTIVAGEITGAHWSGPRFFGLRKRAGRSVESAEGDHVEA